MALDAFVESAMRDVIAGNEEVTVGLARLLRVGARVAPGQFLRIVNRPR
jgi:uncharacterized oxidoreductase